MNQPAQYQRGQVLRVQIEGHREPISMVAIERANLNAGGGLMLMIDRFDGELDAALAALNNSDFLARVHTTQQSLFQDAP